MSSQEEAPHQKNDQPKGLALMRGQQVSGGKQVSRCQEAETPVEKTQNERDRQKTEGFLFPRYQKIGP